MRSRANAKINFQRRHFECIARIVADFTAGPGKLRDDLARHFAMHLRHTNPNFQSDKFIAWANGDERSESEKRYLAAQAKRAAKAAEKAERERIKREQMQPEFTLAEIEKARRIVRDKSLVDYYDKAK